MVSILLWFFLGLVALIAGAQFLVGGASQLARQWGVPEITVGLTVVAFGTSAPELIVNITSAVEGNGALVFGNVIGSNIFNLFAIIGITGIIFPLSVQSSTVWKEIPLSLLAVGILAVLVNGWLPGWGLSLGRVGGIVLLLFFATFLYLLYRQMQRGEASNEVADGPTRSMGWLGVMVLFGLGGLVLGGYLLVDSAVQLANIWGVEERIIGLTIVAAGTSLPELATSAVASWKRNADIAVGNIIGSNIFNIFLILGVSGLVNPLEYAPAMNTELLFLAGGTMLLFLWMWSGTKGKVDRWEAGIFLLAYLLYTGWLVSS